MADFDFKVKESGEWARARELLQTLKRGAKVWDKVVEREANRAARLVKQNFNSRGALAGTPWPPLKRLTWKRKTSKRVLFESGQMAKAIGAKRSGSTWFIGVVSSDPHKGSNIAVQDLAAVHEFGTTIVQEWTLKQRRAFFALLRKFGELRRGRPRKADGFQPMVGGGGRKAATKGRMVVVIKIPARPFVFPVLRKLYVESQDSVEARILKQIKGALRLK